MTFPITTSNPTTSTQGSDDEKKSERKVEKKTSTTGLEIRDEDFTKKDQKRQQKTPADALTVASGSSALSMPLSWCTEDMVNPHYRDPVPAGRRPGLSRFARTVRQVINARRTQRGGVPGSPARPRIKSPGHQKKILAALQESEAKGAPILIIGYSPTGGGHTARCLNIAAMAQVEGSLVKGSTVIVHMPQKWTGKDRPSDVAVVMDRLREQGVNVVVLEADKSVQGFVDEATGASVDSMIIDRIAQMPTRQPADVKSVMDGAAFPAADATGSVSPANYNMDFPSVTAVDLCKTLKDTLKPETIANQTYVLTDMAPDLQHAAHQSGIPDHHRLDQSNHAILMDLSVHSAESVVSEMAVFSKVNGGHGEKVAHIGLGDRNSLTKVNDTTTLLGVKQEQTRLEAMQIVATHLLDKGIDINDAATVARFNSKKRAAGVMRHPDIKSAKDVKNIVYVYAHANQNRIAKHVCEQLAKPDAPTEYRKTLFVFCGHALKSKADVLKACYAADGDGMTTNGAGTSGEFAQLVKKADSKAGLLALPILGHAEQAANSDDLVTNLPDGVVAELKDSSQDDVLNGAVDTFVKERFAKADEKYAADRDMKPFFKSINDPDTYVAHAYKLLFKKGAMTRPEQRIQHNLKVMRKAELLNDTMAVIKAALQVAQCIADKDFKLPNKLVVQLDGRKSEEKVLETGEKVNTSTIKFDGFDEFLDVMSDGSKLAEKFNFKHKYTPELIPSLVPIRKIFEKLSVGVRHGVVNDAEIGQMLHALKDRLGELQIMGF